MNIENKKDYTFGFKRGLPIAVGYLPVSFTFGLTAVSGGLPVWLAIVISLTNVTSAGQFAGTNLITAGAGYLEITLTTFIINIRYMLMSLSISQKIENKTSLFQRLIFAFGITDETFTVASMEEDRLSFRYMLGLITGPIVGWTLGTALGALICSSLPQNLSNAMGIALYGMFIAIIIPPARKSKKVVIVLVVSIAITCILRYVPGVSAISSGFRVIIATVLAAGICAKVYPLEEGGVA
jgi:4-azaleucine resistance transporter AzlC